LPINLKVRKGLRFIINIAITLLFFLCFTQLNGVKLNCIELSQVNPVANSYQSEIAENNYAYIKPFWPIDSHNLDEHLTGEEVSEDEMLSGKKTYHLITRVQSKRKLSNDLAKKPSNESRGILSPPPKA